jgi:hypothetical protein
MKIMLFRAVLICGMATIISVIIIWIYVASFGDSSVELKRGNILDEVLLRSPSVRQFPEELINGRYRYFYSPGEASVGSSNGLIISVPKFKFEYLDKCVNWLEKFGYSTSNKSGQSYVQMTNARGQKATISIDANDIIINVPN